MSQPSVIVSGNPDRPLGVWILTIYAFLFVGLLPFLAAIGLLGFASSELGIDPVSLVFSAFLSLAVMIASVLAWRGNRKAMIALVAMVTVHYVVVGLNNLWLLIAGVTDAGDPSQLVGRVVRGVLYPAVYLWYFRREAPRAFYR